MAKAFGDYMKAYQQQMTAGAVPAAYRGLMQYLMGLRGYFEGRYPDYTVSGSLYFGYMDMSYFSVAPPALKARGLKAAVVFLHENCTFEVWLSGVNRKIQQEYYTLFSTKEWQHGKVLTPGRGVDAVVAAPLVKAPDFDRLDKLTGLIDHGTSDFIDKVCDFLGTAL